MHWENAYFRSFSWYDETVAQQLFGVLGHSFFEKTFFFLFKESAVKPTPLLNANFQMPWHTKCNQWYWQRPECFYEPESPVTTLKSGQPELPVCNIHQSYRLTCIHAGSDKSWKNLGVPKGLQVVAQLGIVNETKYKTFIQIIVNIFELPSPFKFIFISPIAITFW